MITKHELVNALDRSLTLVAKAVADNVYENCVMNCENIYKGLCATLKEAKAEILTGSFVDYVKRCINPDQYDDIMNHGFQGGVSGFIYYDELREIYFHWEDEIAEILNDYDYLEETGNSYLSLSEIAQNRVWFAASCVISSLVSDEEDEIPIRYQEA